VVIVKEFAAEFQIQLAAELGDPPFDLLRLGGEVKFIVKADSRHGEVPFHTKFFPDKYTTPEEIWKEKPENKNGEAA
jgi:hypothetical protein